jgi:O-acetyl-ADP-ribose deacetylase (regulator of RNase III)
MFSDSSFPGLSLDQYRDQIKLDKGYKPEAENISSEKTCHEILDSLLHTLIFNETFSDIEVIPQDLQHKRQLLRALLNIRPPGKLSETFLKNINRLLQYELRKKVIRDCKDLSPVSDTFPDNIFKHSKNLFLWKGDITCLKADAIVNAANDRMLGCFQPLHNCIDNVIHSAAGPLLREDCNTIMDIQGSREQTGDAKITRAYNLPSGYVLHTVGPIITEKKVSEFQQKQLASCYKSCLSLASQIKEINTIAFPCISTGVFNFPQGLAAEIAVRTVDEWLENNSHQFTGIIFNVFLEEDFSCYARVFRR